MAGSRKDVRGRLRAAALELYADRGYDRTTTADVAARAGVTERTYFRHFPDKREVVFDGEAALLASMTGAVADAPDLPPLEVLRHAFSSLALRAEDERDLQARQHRVIVATPELRERAAFKADHLAEAVSGSLERRGTPRPVASLAAACGIGALTRARREWLDGSPRSFAALLTTAFDDLDLLVPSGAAERGRGARTSARSATST